MRTMNKYINPVSDPDALQDLLDASPDVICSFDRDGHFLNLSAACKKLWGYTADELRGRLSSEYIVPADRAKTRAAAKALLSGEQLTHMENRYIRKDGSIVPVMWSARWDARKQILYCVAKDATQKKEAEQKGQLLKRRLHRAYRLAGMAWWELNIATQTYTSSDEIFQMYGLPIPDDHKTSISEFLSHVHPDDFARLQSDLSNLCNDTYFRYEHRVVKPGGEVIYVRHYSELIRDENGVPIALHGTTQDITESVLKEQAEKQLQDRYRLLFYESPTPKWIFSDNTLRIVEVNDAAVAQYGWTREEFLAMTIFELQPACQRSIAQKIHEQTRGMLNLRYHGPSKHITKAGEVLDVEIASHAFQAGEDIHIVAVARNVTEKLNAQKRISQAIISTQEKERSVIGKELHDNVNQLLTTAKLYFENIEYFPEQRQSFMKKGTDIIQRCINEIRGLSKALITPTISDLDFKDALEELISFYKDLNLFSVRLNYNVEKTVLEKDFKVSIYRILQELFNNAVRYAQASEIEIHLEERGDYLRMVYKDNGMGFDPALPRKGVGLTNIKSRVSVHGGKVKFISSAGRGCKVLIVFGREPGAE